MKKIFLGALALTMSIALVGCGSSTADAAINNLGNQLDETANTINNVQTVNPSDITLTASKLESLATSNENISGNIATAQQSLMNEEYYKMDILNKTASLKNTLSKDVSLSKAQVNAVKELTNNLNKYTNSVAYTKNDLSNTVKSISSMKKNTDKNADRINAKLNRLACNSNARASYYENILNTLDQLEYYVGCEDCDLDSEEDTQLVIPQEFEAPQNPRRLPHEFGHQRPVPPPFEEYANFDDEAFETEQTTLRDSSESNLRTISQERSDDFTANSNRISNRIPNRNLNRPLSRNYNRNSKNFDNRPQNRDFDNNLNDDLDENSAATNFAANSNQSTTSRSAVNKNNSPATFGNRAYNSNNINRMGAINGAYANGVQNANPYAYAPVGQALYNGYNANFANGFNGYAYGANGINGGVFNTRFNPMRNTDTYAPLMHNIDTYRYSADENNSYGLNGLGGVVVSAEPEQRLESFEKVNDDNTLSKVEEDETVSENSSIKATETSAKAARLRKVNNKAPKEEERVVAHNAPDVDNTNENENLLSLDVNSKIEKLMR